MGKDADMPRGAVDYGEKSKADLIAENHALISEIEKLRDDLFWVQSERDTCREMRELERAASKSQIREQHIALLHLHAALSALDDSKEKK